jgi:tetratricopeptide (TPR) repeat protein
MNSNFKQPEEPVDAPGLNQRGNRYSRNGVYERAIEDYTRAIEMDGAFAEAYFNRGVSYYELGRYQDAIVDLSRAIQLNPADDNYYSRRSLAYLFADQPELAQADQDRCDDLRNSSQHGQ